MWASCGTRRCTGVMATEDTIGVPVTAVKKQPVLWKCFCLHLESIVGRTIQPERSTSLLLVDADWRGGNIRPCPHPHSAGGGLNSMTFHFYPPRAAKRRTPRVGVGQDKRPYEGWDRWVPAERRSFLHPPPDVSAAGLFMSR